MKPAPFEYVAARSVEQATEALRESDGSGKVIAGGLSLGPLLNLRMSRPSVLVDLNGIPGLSRLDVNDDRLSIGSLVRHDTMQTQEHHPLAAAAGRWIGHGAIRFRGTVGGSIAHADPSAEWPVVAVACDADVTMASPQGTRSAKVTDFFHGALETDLADDEVVTSTTWAVPERWGFAEFARRKGDFALVLVAVTQVRDSWRVVVGGVAPTPLRITAAEGALDAGGLSPSTAKDVASLVEEAVNPTADMHGTTEHRRALTREVTIRALEGAAT